MRRGMLVGVVLLLLAGVGAARAVSVRSWSVSSADEFKLGTLEGTAIDGEGSVSLSATLEDLWGPEQGIVWDVEPDGSGGAFVAVSSPTRVLHVVPGRKAKAWHATGDETLVAAILPDSAGGVYFGLSPDGRLIHSAAPGEAREVADTEALFIWALAGSADGSVWVGTGLPGRLLRIDSRGEIRAVFEAGDDPVRCITALPDGSVVFGTGGRGRVGRVDRDGRTFVLFDAGEAEIVAVEAAEDGTVYALAAQGSKQVAAARSASKAAHASVRVTATPPPSNDEEPPDEGEDPQPEQRRQPPRRFSTPPGGALYRIAPGGDYQRLWIAPDEVPFGLVRRDDGTLLVATGDRGRVHAVDDQGRSSVMVQIPSDQASALSRDPAGTVLVGGTTDARVTRIGPGLRSSGSYVSAVHDAGNVANWGRLQVEAERPSGSTVRVSARAGNTAEPDETWTDWVALAGDAARSLEIELPPTRWIQTRIELEPSRRGEAPRVGRLELFYQPHNRRPVITELTVQPAGVVWMRSPTPGSRPLGPLVASDPVARKTVAGLRPDPTQRPVRKTYELGARTVSWKAADADGDRLSYRLEIRAEGSTAWIPLAVGLETDFHGWDARSMTDGLYRVRLVADDARDNPEGKEQKATRVSAAFRIDNTRPSIDNRRVEHSRGRYEVEFEASDPGGNVAAAEVAVDAGAWEPLDPLDGVADSERERYQLVVEPLGDDAGERPRTVRVRVTDSAGNMGGDAWALDEED